MPDASGREYESYELDLLLQRRYFIQIVALKSIDDLDGFIASSAKPPWIWYHRAGRIYTGPIHHILRGERRVKLPLSSPSRETRDIVSNTSWKYVIILMAISLLVKNGWISPASFPDPFRLSRIVKICSGSNYHRHFDLLFLSLRARRD